MSSSPNRLRGHARSCSTRVSSSTGELPIFVIRAFSIPSVMCRASCFKSCRALPGENLPVRIVKQGDQVGQGVGYLDDGTMVVVEQGRGAIGQEVSITVTSVLQTPAGRMIFGRIDGKPN